MLDKFLHIFGRHYNVCHDPIFARCGNCGKKGFITKSPWDGFLEFTIIWELTKE